MNSFTFLAIFKLALILFFAAGQEPKPYQIAENNVIIRFAERREESAAREILIFAVGARQKLAENYQLEFAATEIRLSATTYEFCQITGRPWWQASIYRGRVIYLQPARVLRERGILEITLRHELMHQLVEESGKGNSPVWLSEALAVYHSGEIAYLKPALKKAATAKSLEWNQLEKSLEKMKTKTAAERLYFQLYHLGRFLEAEFEPRKIGVLIKRLAEKSSFDQACREVLGVDAKALEKRWLHHAASMPPRSAVGDSS